jgi:hypothetical protein
MPTFAFRRNPLILNQRFPAFARNITGGCPEAFDKTITGEHKVRPYNPLI